jgi:hypothetical protein
MDTGWIADSKFYSPPIRRLVGCSITTRSICTDSTPERWCATAENGTGWPILFVILSIAYAAHSIPSAPSLTSYGQNDHLSWFIRLFSVTVSGGSIQFFKFFFGKIIRLHDPLDNDQGDSDPDGKNGKNDLHNQEPFRVWMPEERMTTLTPTQRLRMLGTQMPTKIP